MLEGLLAILQNPAMIAALLLAVTVGVFLGAVPGIGGKLAIVLMLPFLMGIESSLAAVFLLAMHSVIHTGGPIPSILIGVPGSGPDAATVVDGYPMNRNGQAERALGAALGASVVGGAIGVVCLAVLVPLADELVYFAGPRERFLLMLLGLSFVASLSSSRPLQGIIVTCFGLLVAAIGMDPITGTVRYAGDWLFLWEGVNQIGAILAFFAIPEILSLGTKQNLPADGAGRDQRGQTRDGLMDVVRHRWLTLRASAIGVAVSAVPGLGGAAASWIAYSHAVNSSRNPETFGTGRVEGVIAPEAANNSKEGGSLITTLFLGIPSSSGTAVLFSALLALGIAPGTQMLAGRTELVWTFLWALFLANLLSAAVFIGSAGLLARIVSLSRAFLFPVALTLAMTGIYLSALNWETFLMVLVLGTLGTVLKRNDWPRAPFALAVILGPPGELAFHQSREIWGMGFLLEPFSLVVFLFIGFSLYSGWRRGRRQQNASPSRSKGLYGVFALLFSAGTAVAMRYPAIAASLPLAASLLGLVGVTWAGIGTIRQAAKDEPTPGRPELPTGPLIWLGIFVIGLILLGVSPGLPLVTCAYLLKSRRVRTLAAAIIGLAIALIMEVLLVELSGLALFRGLLIENFPI